jgi:hypothetical protein
MDNQDSRQEDLKEAMRETIHSQRVQKWWVEKQHFTTQQIDLMDHNASKNTMGQVRVARKRWVCKFAANYAPVGCNMKRWKFWPDDRCSRCLSNNETARHDVLQCPDPRARQQRLESLAKFEQRLRFIKTAPAICQAIMSQLTEGLNSEQRPLSGSYNVGIRRAIAYQKVLGWEQFMKGRITFHWAILQDFEFRRRQQWNTGASWAAQMVRATWDISWSLWDHRNEILHTSDVLDKLLDMDSIDFAIIEEWHAGDEALWMIDRRQFRGISLDELLAKPSRFRREWLIYVRQARTAATSAGDKEADE